jgi:trk system potassium uptake protein TrkH
MKDFINIKLILKVISRILLIISIAFFICIIISLLYNESIIPFVYSLAVTLFFGIAFSIISKKTNPETDIIKQKEAFLTVTLSWLTMSVIGALPYIFSDSIPSYINAFFESTSGFTTTGSSILTDIESLPKSILFWRSMTHWIGGIGIIVLVILIIPSLRIGGYHLFTIESSFQEKIQPKIRAVGYRILIIYISLTIIEIALLLFGNMNLFESVCHAFGTVATGGFSPKNTSIAEYSPYIQYVIMLFMLLSGVNFIIHYYIIKRKFSQVISNEEFLFYLFIVGFIGLIITSSLIFDAQKPVEIAFREGFFQVISIITCTGYATADYLQWPEYAWVIIFFAMFLGGSTGSTAGGIKMARHLVFFKNVVYIFRRHTHPNAVHVLKLNKSPINDKSNNSILTFILIYMMIFVIGSMVLLLFGVDGKTASSSVATCMAGIGPGIGNVGPASNFAHLPGVVKIILSAIMIIGRLEIYPVLLLFTGHFWKR